MDYSELSPSNSRPTTPTGEGEKRPFGGEITGIRNESLKGFPLPRIGETLTLLRPAVPCLNVADLRELAREFVPEMTGGQITLLGCRGCLDDRDLRESGENCVSFW